MEPAIAVRFRAPRIAVGLRMNDMTMEALRTKGHVVLIEIELLELMGNK